MIRKWSAALHVWIGGLFIPQQSESFSAVCRCQLTRTAYWRLLWSLVVLAPLWLLVAETLRRIRSYWISLTYLVKKSLDVFETLICTFCPNLSSCCQRFYTKSVARQFGLDIREEWPLKLQWTNVARTRIGCRQISVHHVGAVQFDSMMFRSKSAPNKLFWFQNRSCRVCMCLCVEILTEPSIQQVPFASFSSSNADPSK